MQATEHEINIIYVKFKVSFITYDRSVHFYSLPEGASQPTQLTVCDVDDVFLPSPTDILVNLQENNGLVRQLLEALPEMFANSYITESALGAALQVGRSQLLLQTYVSKPLQIGVRNTIAKSNHIFNFTCRLQ